MGGFLLFCIDGRGFVCEGVGDNGVVGFVVIGEEGGGVLRVVDGFVILF